MKKKKKTIISDQQSSNGTIFQIQYIFFFALVPSKTMAFINNKYFQGDQGQESGRITKPQPFLSFC